MPRTASALAGALALSLLPSMAAAASGQLPNRRYRDDQLEQQISPNMNELHHNQPSVVNGWLMLSGNGTHELWDISDPFAPEQVSAFESPHNDGEAESHQVSFLKTSDGRIMAATISGIGVDLWDITDETQPELLSSVDLEGVDYGDNTAAVWGVYWQGDYVYAGGTDTGLHIIDASDPRNASVIRRMPTAELGDVAAGPLYPVGNLLIITTPKEFSGIATLDISDPGDPALLDFVDPPKSSYIGGLFGGNVHLVSPFRTYDVTSDPRNITQIGEAETETSEYLSFGDGLLFLGMRRPEGGLTKMDITDLNAPVSLARIGPRKKNEVFGSLFVDDQFVLPIGNLAVLSDDESDFGSWLAVHQLEPDTRGPRVLYANPADGATLQAPSTRIGISFDDQIEVASLDTSTFTVRPIGGEPIAGSWGHCQTVVSFWPSTPLDPDTTYEVVLPAGGVKDPVGNGLEKEYRAVFSTGQNVTAPPCAIAALAPVVVGSDAPFDVAETADGASYAWQFPGGSAAAGRSVTHRFDAPGHPRSFKPQSLQG